MKTKTTLKPILLSIAMSATVAAAQSPTDSRGPLVILGRIGNLATTTHGQVLIIDSTQSLIPEAQPLPKVPHVQPQLLNR